VARGPQAVIDEIQAIVAELVSAARVMGQPAVGSVGVAASSHQSTSVRAVAVVVPGIVDAAAGRAVFSANLGFRDVPVRDLVQAAVGLPTVLEHDVRAAGVAERTVGSARGVDDYLLAVIGTGIAAVIHAGGEPMSGARGMAGELGHIPVWPDGEPCPCGQRGCLERYALAASITRRYAEFGGSHVASAHEVAARRSSDPAAARAWQEATEALAIAFVTCTMLLDPEMIVLAGGLSAAGQDLLVPVEAELAARITWREAPSVRLSPLGGRAGLLGAAVLAWRLVGEDALGTASQLRFGSVKASVPFSAAADHVPGGLMAAEIAEQPAVLAGLLAGREEIAEARARIAAAKPRFVLIAARGTSDHAALYAKYLVEVRLQLPAGLASPSALTVYGAAPRMTDVLFVAVSQSGGSPDLVDSLTVAREHGALSLAVTNAPDSPLAQAAELAVDVRAGAERAVAATKTYTAELLALHLLFAGEHAARDAAPLPAAAARTLVLTPEKRLEALAAGFRGTQRVVLTARGYSYATALEAALKIMETSYLSAQAFSGADLLHGPLAMVDRSVPVIAITSPGRGGDAMSPVLERLAALGGPMLRVGRGGALRIASDGIAEHLLPILEILPLQRLAWRLALDRGIDPDCPRGLSKVTRTH
jgi:glucosamine--fructose-6-phosphate aminotransferase (isomerizing)